jgi:hypothetical protein
MKFTVAAVASALVAAVAAQNVTWVTEVHTAYTTYCPESTTLTFGSLTYTVTEVSKYDKPESAKRAISRRMSDGISRVNTQLVLPGAKSESIQLWLVLQASR